MKPSKVKFVKMFKMGGVMFPDLTVGKVYNIDSLSESEFCIKDDRNGKHWFGMFGLSSDGFKTEDYFEIVE